MPKISVILPIYNVENYLRECLDSIINQAIQDIEIICVDDGSTDTSLQILNEYAQNHSEFIILRQKNMGAGEARNAGLRIAQGKFVYFMDADDFLTPHKLSEVVNLMETSGENCDFCIFGYLNFDNRTKQITPCNLKQFFDKNETSHIKQIDFEKEYASLIASYVVPWNKLYCREFLLKNNLFFDNLKCANDRSFYFNSIFKSKKVLLFNEPVIHYRTNISDSLVTKRAQNFSCMYSVYFNVMSSNNLKGTQFEDLFKFITLNDAFYWYTVCTKEERKLIQKSLEQFVNQLYSEAEIKKMHSKEFWYREYLKLKKTEHLRLFGKMFNAIKFINS